MVFREPFESQDFRRMCKHVEREHESKKLDALIGRLNRQLAEQGKSNSASLPSPPAVVLPNAAIPSQLTRLAIFER
jgi:hypothetical protein